MDFISQSHKAVNAIMKKKKAATLREIVGVALFAGKDYSKTGTQWWLMAVSRAFAVATLLLFFGKEMVEGAVAALVLMTLSIFGDLVITLIAFWHQQNKRLTEPRFCQIFAIFIMICQLLFVAGCNVMLSWDMSAYDHIILPVFTCLLLFSILILGEHLLFAFSYAAISLTATLALFMPISMLLSVIAILIVPATLLVIISARYIHDRYWNVMTKDIENNRAKMILNEFERSGHGWFWETDYNGKITYFSPLALEYIRKTKDEIYGQKLLSLFYTTENNPSSERSLNFYLASCAGFKDLELTVKLDNSIRNWALSGTPYYNNQGNFLGFRGFIRDLTSEQKKHKAVQRMAHYDTLTGLANRQYIQQLFHKALINYKGQPLPCALFLMDLDRFKIVNDTMGHPAGDQLLRQVAERLSSIIHEKGQVGRIGGDEFQIVLPQMIEKDKLGALAQHIITTLSEPYTVEGQRVVIGISIGIVIANGLQHNAMDVMMRNADIALYSAKEAGRGTYSFYDSTMHNLVKERRKLEVELRKAMECEDFDLHYQPIVKVDDGKISGFETLIRWRHPQLGSISPAKFIPVAEEAGLIKEMGAWVMREACKTAANWPPHIRVAVNISPIQFADVAIVDTVKHALMESGLSPDRLELEITESVFLNGSKSIDMIFQSLKKLGVRLALDDFGTGYSALGYLKKVKFDKIKIDQSFVRGALSNKGTTGTNSAIIRSIVTLANDLGMDTTAEGAETQAELDFVRSMGFSHVQGYIYGRPGDAQQVEEIFAEYGAQSISTSSHINRAKRFSYLRTIGIVHENYCYKARIKNISSSGALVEGLSNVPNGEKFRLNLGENLSIDAECRWSIGDKMGLQFLTALDFEMFKISKAPVVIPGPMKSRKYG